MKMPKLPVRKKIRASTARRSMGSVDEMDYEEMSEPNMKLSRALLIVLVLHVVAVAGIIAFNTIKSRQGAFPDATAAAAPARSNPASVPPSDASAAAPAAAANDAPLPKRDDAKPAMVVGKISPEGTTVARALPVDDSGKVYVVEKGDNPVKIAKKLNVSQQELLAANNITDPTKLQIGQKLIVPESKTPATAKASPKKEAAKAPPKATAKASPKKGTEKK